MTAIMRRPIAGWGKHSHPNIAITPGFPGRPCNSYSAPFTGAPAATMSGPGFKGMDPSDPATYTRPWAPQPGMISYLNFDGAQLQDRSPTGGNQRGRQSRPRKLRVGM
jgi:hypothetical protein